ncbi:hypothetical protein [Nonomuraea sp. CA-141351]|uniref:hypothetical protein n=1 Tax=Nonomuraea sp. CA-141351 TaxID=3239996 RepID=UPI003D8CCB49
MTASHPPTSGPAGTATARTSLRATGAVAALLGGPLFLIGTVLHPGRDGYSIAAVGQLYGVTHDVQAIGLLLQVISLVGVLASGGLRLGRHAALGWYSAMAGTLAWFGLIVFDGSHNPVTARYAPQIVHTPADLDTGGAIIVVPALLLFPIGYAVLASLLARHGRRWTGLLLGTGAVVYTVGGLLIFISGPRSPFIQILEVAGATLYAAGFVALGRAVRRAA